MVSKIGQSNYALFTLATSFISLFIMDFGLSASVSRYVAKYRTEEDAENKINSFISTINWLYLVIDLVLFLILTIIYFFLGIIYKGLTNEELMVFRSLYIIVAIYSIVSFPFLPLTGIINAYEKFIQQKFCELFQKIFSIAIIIISLLVYPDVKLIVLGNALSGLITIAIKLVIIKKSTKVKIKLNSFNKEIAKEVFNFSVWITIMSLAQRCIFNLAPTILGVVSNSREIALFAPANAIESYFYSFAAAINGLFLATISRYIANKEENKITDLSIKIGRYQIIVLSCVFVAFLAGGKQFMISWMGEDYVKSYYCAILMFIPDILLFSQQIPNTTMIAMNKVKEQALGYVGMSIVCLIISFAICKLIGSIGSALAIAISYIFLFIYMNFLYKKILKLDLKIFFKNTYMALAIPFIFGSVFAIFIQKIFFIEGWKGVFFYGSCSAIFYLILCIPFLNKVEKNLIKSVFNKYKRRY